MPNILYAKNIQLLVIEMAISLAKLEKAFYTTLLFTNAERSIEKDLL